jgi:hypothetical protein
MIHLLKENSFAATQESRSPWAPKAVVEPLEIDVRTIHVVREDLLPGGTKQRAVVPFLNALRAHDYSEFVYASPFCGFAQVALAAGCQALGLKATIFCERDAGKQDPALHEFSLLARSMGAKTILVDSLEQAENVAMSYSLSQERARYKIPLGFQHPDFHCELQKRVKRELMSIESILGKKQRRIRLPVGSGTLTRAFLAIVPKEVELICVDVHVLDRKDARIRSIAEYENVTLLSAPEEFQEPAGILPKIPSNTYYDAKLWRLIRKLGQDGDLWWNVAR